jgi:glutamyl/glutaminyl-tRNA synthetase
VFEFDKLNWMNGHYIRHMAIADITERVKPYLKNYDLSRYSQQELESIVAAVREPLTTLGEITDAVSYFFGDSVCFENDVKTTVIDTPESQTTLKEFLVFADNINYDNIEALHDQLAEFRKSIAGLKPKQIMWAIRAALTGRIKGADIAVIISVLGKNTVKLRVKNALSGN